MLTTARKKGCLLRFQGRLQVLPSCSHQHFLILARMPFFYLEFGEKLDRRATKRSRLFDMTDKRLPTPSNFQVQCRKFKTDRSKKKIFSFGGNVLADKKSGQICVGPFLIKTIMLFLFVLTFLLWEGLLSEKGVIGNWVGWFWLIPCQNSSLVPWRYSRVPSQLTYCLRRSTSSISVHPAPDDGNDNDTQ